MEQYASIGRNMNIADKYFRMYLRDALKKHDLNTAEGTVLLSLYGKNKTTESQIFDAIHIHTTWHTQDQLIDELQYDRGVMTRTMKALEEKEYVLRSDNPDDCRSYIFSLTKKALDFKPILVGMLYEWNACLLEGIDANTLKIVENALEVMAKNAMQHSKE